MAGFNIWEMNQSFWQSVKYRGRCGIFAGTVYMLKVENFKFCRRAKFSPCHSKTKIPAHLKFRPKCPLSTCLRWSKAFENRLNTFGRYRIIAGTVCTLKVGNFKSCRWESFHLAIAKVKLLRTWEYMPKCPFSICVRWSKVFENRLNTFGDMGFLLGQFTGWKWEISNLVNRLSFYLAIAKVQYLRTWNFRPICPVSTRLRRSKVFENRLNTFGDMGICWDSLQVGSVKFQILSMG